MPLSVLLVNSDADYINEILYSFESENYNFIIAKTIGDAIEKFKNNSIDLTLIDMSYSDGTGLDLKKEMNEVKDVPTIVVTKEAEDIQKVLALEYGADDYVVRPFNMLELKARIRAVLRRTRGYHIIEKEKDESDRFINIDGFVFNIVGRKVMYGDLDIELTGKEYDLLYILASNKRKVFSREVLAEELWGQEHNSHLRTVDVHIRRLREKLSELGSVSNFIKTKWGEGYFYEEDDEGIL